MWYSKVVDDIGKIPDFIKYYEKELEQARNEVNVKGNLERNAKELPANTEVRFSQLQDIEAVLNLLNIQMRKLRKEKLIEYERYQKALSSREVEKYVDGEDDVVDLEMIINEVALIRNKYLGIMKGFDSKQWMISHITKLRSVGLEDVEI